MSEMKRTAVVGDFSGVGTGVLNAALPILSAAGAETCAVVTSVLSANSLNAGESIRRDLSEDVPGYVSQWKKLGLRFDAVLCSLSDAGNAGACAFAESFCTGDCFLMVDPAPGCGPFSPEDEDLLCRADLIVPDIREAARLLGEEEREGPYERGYVERLLRNLCLLGPKMAVVKGIWFSGGLIGAAGFDFASGLVSYAFTPRVEGEYSGSGTVFSPALLAGFLNGMNLTNAMQFAVDFTADCMRRMRESGRSAEFGLKFEASLPRLIRELGLEDR